MRLLAAVIAVVALAGVVVYTNPRLEDYNNFIRQSIMQESQKRGDGSLEQAFGSIMGGIAGSLLTSQTIRTDYVVCSTYEAQFGKARLKVLGVFRNFFFLEKPEFLKHHHDTDHGRSRKTP